MWLQQGVFKRDEHTPETCIQLPLGQEGVKKARGCSQHRRGTASSTSRILSEMGPAGGSGGGEGQRVRDGERT